MNRAERRKLPPAIRAAVEDYRCPDCDSDTRVHQDSHGTWRLEVLHDATCPWLTRYEPTKANKMTQSPEPTAADHRRATALVCHHGRENLAGINEILTEATGADRAVQLIIATLDLHAGIIPLLLTDDGLACFSGAVYVLGEDESQTVHTRRAVQLVTAHNARDDHAINEVLHTAAEAGQATHLLLAVLNVFSSLMPILYTAVGLQTLERSILDWARREQSDPNA